MKHSNDLEKQACPQELNKKSLRSSFTITTTIVIAVNLSFTTIITTVICCFVLVAGAITFDFSSQKTHSRIGILYSQ